MRAISIYNKKGGTGKTSLATTLASALAMLGYLVGLIDGDEQANASALIRPYQYSKPTLTHVVCDDIPLLQAMYQARRNLWVVPADMHLNRAVERIHANSELHLLSEHVDTLRASLAEPSSDHRLPWRDKPEIRLRDFKIERPTAEEFRTPPPYLDFLILDNPPNPNALTWAMLYACDELLIPVELEEYAFQGLAQMFEDVSRRFKKQQQQIKIAGIVPFNVMHQRSMTVDYLSSVWRAFPSLVKHSVHTDATVPSSQGNQETVYETNRSSRAAKEIFALALQLTNYAGNMSGLEACDHCATARNRAQMATERG
ncbi:MAG TPA: ParA family protein [Ktedonobacteraceae bacterium]|nr:ParA family protein [Ktedonobacteraceae bacterium]